MRILLADDQPSVRSAIRLLLEQQPEVNVIEEVSDAQELLNYAINCCPDVLLLDWELPRLSPEILLMKLRIYCPDIFTIVLDSKPQIRHTALETGANDFVSKNDPPERLLIAVKSSSNYSRK